MITITKPGKPTEKIDEERMLESYRALYDKVNGIPPNGFTKYSDGSTASYHAEFGPGSIVLKRKASSKKNLSTPTYNYTLFVSLRKKYENDAGIGFVQEVDTSSTDGDETYQICMIIGKSRQELGVVDKEHAPKKLYEDIIKKITDHELGLERQDAQERTEAENEERSQMFSKVFEYLDPFLEPRKTEIFGGGLLNGSRQ